MRGAGKCVSVHEKVVKISLLLALLCLVAILLNDARLGIQPHKLRLNNAARTDSPGLSGFDGPAQLGGAAARIEPAFFRPGGDDPITDAGIFPIAQTGLEGLLHPPVLARMEC